MGVELSSFDQDDKNVSKFIDRYAQEEELVLNQINYLLDLAKGASEKQIRVQKTMAKQAHFKLIQNMISKQSEGIAKKLIHVDLKELWKETSDFDINRDMSSMTDDEYRKFFDDAKRFEAKVFDAFQDAA